MTPSRAAEGVLRVVIVDDSAYVRKVVREILSRSPFIDVVGAARDGHEALQMVDELKPDVVTCDLVMPEMDGVAFVRAQMLRRAVPVVIISAVPENHEQVLAALDAGAVDFVHKPTSLATDRICDIGADLIAKVKAAAGAPRQRLHSVNGGVEAPIAMPAARAGGRLIDLIVIGISTGGPQALRSLIPRFPTNLPVPVAVVLHMPVGYTELYARKLDDLSALTVKEASDGEPLRAGTVLVAPGGKHLSIRRAAVDGMVACVDVRPRDVLHRPSVDILFQSAAEVCGGRVLGVVMTGMGSDGRDGSAWIKAKGGIVLTEAEATCVVYGMPRSVVEAGLSDASHTLERMPRAIMERI
jgi:two-component system, chemotaxis family, protein-glutamate methylesterase/glutaminase